MNEQSRETSKLIEEISALKERIQELEKSAADCRRAEEEVRESRQDLLNILNFLPDSTLVINREGRVIVWNKAIETMTGIQGTEMLGRGNYEYALPFYNERRPILIDLVLNPDERMERHYTTIERMGDTLFAESFTPGIPPGDIHVSAAASLLRNSRGEAVAAIECIRDNTERKRLQERLSRAEKREGMGRLAGSVAHDLNNVLGVIVGYSELLAESLPAGSPLKKYSQHIVQSSMRCADIVQDLLTLLKKKDDENHLGSGGAVQQWIFPNGQGGEGPLPFLKRKGS